MLIGHRRGLHKFWKVIVLVYLLGKSHNIQYFGEFVPAATRASPPARLTPTLAVAAGVNHGRGSCSAVAHHIIVGMRAFPPCITLCSHLIPPQRSAAVFRIIHDVCAQTLS